MSRNQTVTAAQMNRKRPATRTPKAVAATRLADITTEGLEVFAPYLMNRILRRYNETVEDDVRAAGLSVPRLRILAVLSARGPLSVNDLAVLAVAEQSSTSRLVDQMVKENLVSREIDERDNRSRIVSLTPKGQRRFTDVFPAMQAAEAEMMAGVSDRERQQLLKTLQRMLLNVRNVPI